MRPIQPGDTVRSPRWPEPIEVNLIEEHGAYVRIVGRMCNSGRHVDQLVPRADLETVSITPLHADFAASPRDVFLRLEALRYRYACSQPLLLTLGG